MMGNFHGPGGNLDFLLVISLMKMMVRKVMQNIEDEENSSSMTGKRKV